MDALDSVEEFALTDHKKTKKLGKGLQELGCILTQPVTNIILFTPPKNFTIPEFLSQMTERGVLAYQAYVTDYIRFQVILKKILIGL